MKLEGVVTAMISEYPFKWAHAFYGFLSPDHESTGLHTGTFIIFLIGVMYSDRM